MQMTSFAFEGPGPVGAFFASAVAIILIAAWIILAGSRFVGGGVVERPERVPQLYGYTVCLIGLIWALGSVIGLVESSLALAAPEYHRKNDYGLEPSITSIETFRLTYDRARQFSSPDPSAAKPDPLSEAELQKRYASYRAGRIEATKVEARQSLVLKTVSLLLAVGVFVFHWRWLRRRGVAPVLP